MRPPPPRTTTSAASAFDIRDTVWSAVLARTTENSAAWSAPTRPPERFFCPRSGLAKIARRYPPSELRTRGILLAGAVTIGVAAPAFAQLPVPTPKVDL